MRVSSANQTAPATIWTVLSKPAFSVLWLSEAVSLIGDRILMIALINMVYEWSGSAVAVSALSLIKAIPALVLGTVAERYRRPLAAQVGDGLLQPGSVRPGAAHPLDKFTGGGLWGVPRHLRRW